MGHPAASVIQGSFPHGVQQHGAFAPAQARVSPHARSVQLRPEYTSTLPRGGHPLPAAVLQKMESAFGAKFHDVRVHMTPHARQLGALALTHGTNIYFAPGQYNPSTPAGQRLIAHELAHVVQQRSGRVRNAFNSGVALVHDAVMEADAERMAHNAMRASAQPRKNGSTVQRRLVIRHGPLAGAYNGAAPAAFLNALAARINGNHAFSWRTVKRGPLDIMRDADDYTLDNGDELIEYMTDLAHDLDYEERVGRLAALQVQYDAAHGDYHFTGHVTAKKAQWTTGKQAAQTLMEAQIQHYRERLLAESAAVGWTPWYIIADAPGDIGDTVAGSVSRYTMQVQVHRANKIISYHGYPDQRAIKTGIGKSKSSVS